MKRCNMIRMSMDMCVLLLFAVVSTGLVNGICPSTCLCVDDSSGSNVDCYSRYLGHIPALPNDTYHLNLLLNNITVIDIQFCKEMPQLQYIFIDFNLITDIPVNTFADCEKLYRIDLHNNKIRSIESNTFVNMTNLYYLEWPTIQMDSEEKSASAYVTFSTINMINHVFIAEIGAN
ncbi:unnamed protein product [Mytilus edulis]|uniref:LRRNT domain-containing protein n=1 Tax=Mytilus edulis TaxID=6550 RepID=A0A8S3S723_MYTED|nr:unnamed protein product [Mytilus edulis]